MLLFLTLVVSSTILCCSDDGIVKSIGTAGENLSEDVTFAFDISLDALAENDTRKGLSESMDQAGSEGEGLENSIDVLAEEHGFHILFLDTDDNFLFEPKREEREYTIEQVTDYLYDTDNNRYSGNTKRWRVKIPAYALIRSGAYTYMKENNFKIAILANWPKGDDPTFVKGEKIQKLSHYCFDKFYAEEQKQALGFLTTEDGLMGCRSEWVVNAYTGNEDAAKAIRNNNREKAYTMNRQKNGGLGVHTYKHVWRVWNFGDDELLGDMSDSFKQQWTIDDNYKDILSSIAMKGLSNYGGFYENDGLYFGKYIDVTGTGNGDGERVEIPTDMNLTGCSYDAEKGCLVVPEGLTADQHNDGRTNQLRDVGAYGFHFRAFAAGKLIIKAKKHENQESKDVYIGIQTRKDRGNGNDNKSDRKALDSFTRVTEDNFTTYELSNVSVTGTIDGSIIPGEPLDIYIYSVGGTIDFYQIEYIEDRRLYDTDREGRMLDKGHLIPMYGIQQFTAIGGYIEQLIPGDTLNLSSPTLALSSHPYPYKKVYLLRSLAKVELLLPSDWNPSHLYFRSNNRTNRCEPMDVSTPTNILWSGGGYNGEWYNGVDREMDAIQEYGSFYDPNKKKDYDAYRNKLSWFYGAWLDWGWVWRDYTPAIPRQAAFPRIFNADINRSDYTHFIKQGTTENGYTRYILYVSEKNIEDPNSHGDMSDTPKVPHIELRFKGINDDANLDDNDCYRIYFVEKQPNIGRDEYDDFEKDMQYCGPVPIMRNHIYRFTVTGVNAGGTPQVNFDLCTPALRQADITFE